VLRVQTRLKPKRFYPMSKGNFPTLCGNYLYRTVFAHEVKKMKYNLYKRKKGKFKKVTDKPISRKEALDIIWNCGIKTKSLGG